MAKVNPPSYIKLPEKLRADKEAAEYFDQLQFVVYQLWLRTGGQEDLIADANNVAITYNQAQLTEINARIGSGDPLTSDETGFTVDSDRLSVDMTEA